MKNVSACLGSVIVRLLGLPGRPRRFLTLFLSSVLIIGSSPSVVSGLPAKPEIIPGPTGATRATRELKVESTPGKPVTNREASTRDAGGLLGSVIGTTISSGERIFLIAPNGSSDGGSSVPEGRGRPIADTKLLLARDPNGHLAVEVEVPEGAGLTPKAILTDAVRDGLYGRMARQSERIEAEAVRVDEDGSIVLLGPEDSPVDSGVRTASRRVKARIEPVNGARPAPIALEAPNRATQGKAGATPRLAGSRQY